MFGRLFIIEYNEVFLGYFVKFVENGNPIETILIKSRYVQRRFGQTTNTQQQRMSLYMKYIMLLISSMALILMGSAQVANFMQHLADD